VPVSPKSVYQVELGRIYILQQCLFHKSWHIRGYRYYLNTITVPVSSKSAHQVV